MVSEDHAATHSDFFAPTLIINLHSHPYLAPPHYPISEDGYYDMKNFVKPKKEAKPVKQVPFTPGGARLPVILACGGYCIWPPHKFDGYCLWPQFVTPDSEVLAAYEYVMKSFEHT